MIRELKHEGYGIFWEIVERLHGAGGWLEDDMDAIAYAIRCDRITLEKVVHNYGFFDFKGGKFTSHRVLQNVKAREEKSLKAKQSAKARWDADAMRPLSERNAIKERKGKERKSNDKSVDSNGKDHSKNPNWIGTRLPTVPELREKGLL